MGNKLVTVQRVEGGPTFYFFITSDLTGSLGLSKIFLKIGASLQNLHPNKRHYKALLSQDFSLVF